MILEYIKNNQTSILEYIKNNQTSQPPKTQHVIHILDFKPLKEGEHQGRISHIKKIGQNIVAGNTEKDLFVNFTAKTKHKVSFELTEKQKDNLENRVKYYTYCSTPLTCEDFLETTVKDQFFSSPALDFLAKEASIFSAKKKSSFSFENLTTVIKRVLPRGSIDPELYEIYDHVVLVHAIKQDTAFEHGMEAALKMGIGYDALVADQKIQILAAILGTLTPEGLIGKHLDLEQRQFKGTLLDRPHLHWCWNMLVEPNGGGDWENAGIAILEPLNAFIADKQDHLFGLAPYDTLSMGKHLLSSDSIIIVPGTVFEKARAYLTSFKGCILCYDEKTTTLRQVITRILKKYYPNTWPMCDERGRPISDEGKYSRTGYRPMTCMRANDGKIIRLIEDENRALGKSMRFPADHKRFVGLHVNSQTYVLEDGKNSYFKTLKLFKSNHKVVKTSPLFAGNIKEIGQLDNLGSLSCLALYNRLQEYAPETGAHEFADYIINEAIYADIISLYFSKASEFANLEFSSLDFQIITQHLRNQLLATLEKIQKGLEGLDEQTGNSYSDYCNMILKAFEHLQNAKLKASSMLFKEGEGDWSEWLKKSSIFMGHFEQEFARLPIITPPAILEIELVQEAIPHEIDWNSLKINIGNSWPLDPHLHAYVNTALQVMPNDLVLLARLHFLLHFFATNPESCPTEYPKRHGYNFEARYRCEILKAVIEWVMQEKIYLEPNESNASPFFEPFKVSGKNEPTQEFPQSIFVRKLCEIQKYSQYFSQRREKSNLCLKNQENRREAFIAVQMEANEKELFVEEPLVAQSTLQEYVDDQDFLLPDVTSTEFLRGVVNQNPTGLSRAVSAFFPLSESDVSLRFEIDVQRHLFRVLVKDNQKLKVFDYLLQRNEKAADSCFKENISFFFHPNFIKMFLPIIAFQNQFIYIHYLAKKGVPVNALSEDGKPLAHRVIVHGLHNAFESLLKAPDFQIKTVDADGNTLLHIIAKKRDEKAYAILEEHPHFSSILNAKNAVGETAILIACKNKHFNLVGQLMELDEIDLEIIDSGKKTLLHYFVEAEEFVLLSRFITLSRRQRILNSLIASENERKDPIFFKTKNLKILRWLIESGFDLTQTHPTTQETLLFVLVRENKEDLVKLYCKMLKADHPNSSERVLNHTVLEENQKKSALIIATENNYYRILKILINEGVHFSFKQTGINIFDCASRFIFTLESNNILKDAFSGNVERPLRPNEIIDALKFCFLNQEYERARKLINKIVKDTLPSYYYDSLILVILKSHFLPNQEKCNLVKLLLQGPHTDNINQSDWDGTTPLIWAVKNDFEIVKCLLTDPNIDVNLCDKEGNTALHYASSRSASTHYVSSHGTSHASPHYASSESMINSTHALLTRNAEGKVPANPNIQNLSGKTPLHLTYDLKIAELLIKHGATRYIRDKQGQTPHDCARSARNEKLVKFLKEFEPNLPFSIDAWQKKVFNKISNHEISAKDIINVLSENSKIKEFYDKSAGVVEGYTVGQHTVMVLELTQRYRSYLKPQISEYMEWNDFLLFLSLHDIEKGVSKEVASHTASAKDLELEANRKVTTWILEQLRVRSHIGHLFQALLMYNSQGDYLKGDINADCFKDHLLNMSAVSNLAPHAFYQIYSVFHLVDAASYPNLRPLFVFEKKSLRHCEGNQSLIDYLHQILS